MQILGYMELPDEDQPNEEIWLDTEALAGHFAEVRDRWKNKHGGDGKNWESIEDAPMTENELAKEWRRE